MLTIPEASSLVLLSLIFGVSTKQHQSRSEALKHCQIFNKEEEEKQINRTQRRKWVKSLPRILRSLTCWPHWFEHSWWCVWLCLQIGEFLLIPQYDATHMIMQLWQVNWLILPIRGLVKARKMQTLTTRKMSLNLFWCDSSYNASLCITTKRRLKNSSQLTVSVWNMCPIMKYVRSELGCIVVKYSQIKGKKLP